MPAELDVFGHAGHGKPDSGNVAKDGTEEADLNLAILYRVCDVLTIAYGYTCKMSRHGQIGKDSMLVTADVKAAHPRVCISIHNNDADAPSARGIEVWTSRGEDKSDILATLLYKLAPLLLPGTPMRTDYVDGDPDKEKNWNIVRPDLVGCPAVLIECGFMSNPAELELLKSSDYRSRLAFWIAAGIHGFLSLYPSS